MFLFILLGLALANASSDDHELITELSSKPYCLSSYQDGHLLYTNKQNQSTLRLQILTNEELEKLENVLFLYVNVSLTVAATDNSSAQSEWKLYILATSSILASVGPQVLDVETLNALMAVQRSKEIHLKAIQSSTCDDSDISHNTIVQLFAQAYGFNGIITLDSSIDQAPLPQKMYPYILVYITIALFSVLIEFVIYNYLTAYCATKFCRDDNSIKWNVATSGVYLVCVCFLGAYLGYWTIQTYNFVVSLHEKLYLIHLSFIINTIAVCVMILLTYVAAALLETKYLKRNCSVIRNNGPKIALYKLFQVVGFCCAQSLLVCVIYHSIFLLIALIIDYNTILYEVSYLLTYLIISLVGLPTILMQFLVTRFTRKRGELVTVCTLILSVPCLYFTAVSGLQLLNANCLQSKYSVDATQLVLLLVISIISVIVIVSIALLVFNRAKFTPRTDATEENDDNTHQQPTIKISPTSLTSKQGRSLIKKVGKYGGGSKAVAIMLLSNPSVLRGMKTVKRV